MAENLRTTHYANGDEIPNGTGNDISGEIKPKYWFDYYDPEEGDIFGRLYTWYATIDSRNVCPVGWHVSTDADWYALIAYLGGESIAGGKLKEIGDTNWRPPNLGATNESGFTALPGGWYLPSLIFDNIYERGYWWAVGEYNAFDGMCPSLSTNSNGVFMENIHVEFGLSVRCVMD